MESRAKIFGHAIHPILIVYPLGLLSAAVIFDVIYLVTANPTWTTVSFWMIAAGIIGGLLAAVFGLIDYLNIPSGTRASRVGMLHGLTNLGVLILFSASWLLRWNTPETPPTPALAYRSSALSRHCSAVGLVVSWLSDWVWVSHQEQTLTRRIL